MPPPRKPRSFAALSLPALLLLALFAAGCSFETKNAARARHQRTTLLDGGLPVEVQGDVVLGSEADGIALNPLLLGTNLPAWVSPGKLDKPFFFDSIEKSGTTLLRLPGGSWSNAYSWAGCQASDDSDCYWTWALRPSDFMEVMVRTGLPAMWTVSFNGTPEEAAALVAFFNGEVGDETTIGADQRGTGWKTVDHWARWRAELGYSEPVPIAYWEVGNEIYGAVESAGPHCAPWGWEEVATCDGVEYVEGVDDQQGFLDFAAAMRAVDPTIEIGAVGVVGQSEWGNWGKEVLAGTRDQADFYVMHHYGFDGDMNVEAALAMPYETWSWAMDDFAQAATEASVDPALAVAVTEYNLVSFLDADVEARMTQAINMFYMAETIGEMSVTGVDIATQWNLMNGTAWNGTDYGIVDVDTGEIAPQFYALRLWSLMGATLLPVTAGVDEVSAYATIDAARRYAVMLINPTDGDIDLDVELPVEGQVDVVADVAVADTMQDQHIAYNGVEVGSVVDLDPEPQQLGSFEGVVPLSLPSLSVTVIRFEPAALR